MLTGCNRDRRALYLLDPTGERSPNADDVELPVNHLFNLPPRLVLRPQVSIRRDDRQRLQVLDAEIGQHDANGRVLVSSDLQLLQPRIVEPLEVVVPVAEVGEHVGRAIDRDRRQNRRGIRRHVEKDVALVVGERLACQTALQVRPPKITDARTQMLRDRFDDLVLVALLLVVGERHVSRIGTHRQGADLAPLGRLLGGCDLRRRQLLIGSR